MARPPLIVAKPFFLLTVTKCIKRESYGHLLRISECSTFDYNCCFCGPFLFDPGEHVSTAPELTQLPTQR